MYYIYMLRCSDNSIYTGITTDIEKRMNEHFSKDEKCAKYTKSKTAIKLERFWKTDTRANASKLEYRIKHLSKKQKEELIVNPKLLDTIFNKEINKDAYEIQSNRS